MLWASKDRCPMHAVLARARRIHRSEAARIAQARAGDRVSVRARSCSSRPELVAHIVDRDTDDLDLVQAIGSQTQLGGDV